MPPQSPNFDVVRCHFRELSTPGPIGAGSKSTSIQTEPAPPGVCGVCTWVNDIPCTVSTAMSLLLRPTPRLHNDLACAYFIYCYLDGFGYVNDIDGFVQRVIDNYPAIENVTFEDISEII